MSEISAALVKELREKTGAGMMDCKKALSEVNGNLEEAVDWLRKKGLAAAAKKAGRVASEGLVAASVNGNVGAVVEVNSETDFVSRNEAFQEMVENIAKIAAQGHIEHEKLLTAPYLSSGHSVSDEIVRLVSVIGENMNLRRVASLNVNQGLVTSYIHSAVKPGVGKIGVLVALESTGDKTQLESLGKKIAMHIAAAQPQALNVEGVDPTSLERERSVLIEQARASGRPEDIIQKMVEGRIRKFYEEVVLLEQTFVMDGQTKIADVVAEEAKAMGTSIQLTGFIRYALGEGIEKAESNFAEEVQAQAGLK